jgi:hypothetical protein
MKVPTIPQEIETSKPAISARCKKVLLIKGSINPFIAIHQ